MADAPVEVEPQTPGQEAKADAPDVSEKPTVKASSPTTSLAASGKGKRGASHPMALPIAVNEAFVDVALTAKSDEARPALAVSGKAAAIPKLIFFFLIIMAPEKPRIFVHKMT